MRGFERNANGNDASDRLLQFPPLENSSINKQCVAQ